MKKILYLHAGSEMYGADKVLLELIKGLDKNEFEPHVILPSQGVLVDALKEKGVRVSVLDYPILRRKYFNLKGIIQYILAYFRYSKQIVAYAKTNNVDIIHNNTTAVLEGIYLKLKLRIPLIWHVHEIIVKPKLISDVINFLMGKFADKIVTVSDAVKEHISKTCFIKEEQLSVIYNGVDNTIYYPMDNADIRKKYSIADNERVVGMIGRVNSWKGQNNFLEALVPILRTHPKTKILLAGSAFEGEEWRVKELEDKIASLDVASQIIRIDYCQNTTELYNLFDIFVLPSTSPDPLPTVVLEAMACAKPIVAYRHGGVCEMVKENENGLFAEPNNIPALSNAILNLIDDEEKIKEFSKNSLERQKNLFSLNEYRRHFSELYNKVGRSEN